MSLVTNISLSLAIKLAPLLPTSVAVVQFPDVHAATSASRDIVNSGTGIREPLSVTNINRVDTSVLSECIELCDSDFMAATNKFGMSARSYPEKDSLFLKFQGPTTRSIEEAASIAKEISEKHGGSGFALANTEKEADDLWKDRKVCAFIQGLQNTIDADRYTECTVVKSFVDRGCERMEYRCLVSVLFIRLQ